MKYPLTTALALALATIFLTTPVLLATGCLAQDYPTRDTAAACRPPRTPR